MSNYRNFVARIQDPFWAHWILDADHADEAIEADERLPRQTLRDRENPLESLNSEKFRQIFGFSKDGFNFVLNLLLPQIQQNQSDQPAYLTPVQKLSVFLDFLRTNSFQRTIGTQHHNQISQGRCCIIINDFSRMVANLRNEYVKMPSPEEASQISDEIFQATGFPFVQGIVDGTHLEILKPIVKEPPAAPQEELQQGQPRQEQPLPEKYFNRKGYYSINAMVVVDNKNQIRYFTARHCGSAHDSRIFNESDLRATLEQTFDPDQPRILIGDEGYPCSRVLVTPIRRDRVVTQSQKNYNKSLCNARITIEHTFGMLKKRFPALLYQSRCRKLENLQAIFAAAIVLHNITLVIREDPPILPPNIREPAYREQLQRAQILLHPRGRQEERNFETRNLIIGTYF